MPTLDLHPDVLIFGGGAAGLWLLDDLTRAGYTAILLEAHALGSGQTVASQGIIHGGLKYSLAGLRTDSADAIKHLPQRWRDCLAGRASPDLSHTRLRAEYCHLWATDSFMSRLGTFGASLALQVKPVTLPRDQWPWPLAGFAPGSTTQPKITSVSRLDEQVIDPASFIADLASQHQERILKIDTSAGLRFETALGSGADTPGHTHVHLTDPDTRRTLFLQPKTIILAAGQGNAVLRARLGLAADAMQRRPLHVAMARGPLPEFQGHCVDGSKTRITITSDRDSDGRTIWQLGGQVSEVGVKLDRIALIEHVKQELLAVLPGLRESGLGESELREFDLRQVRWSTYRVDRAEGATRNQQRPADAVVRREGNIITCWPTKLVLAPQASTRIVRMLEPPGPPCDLGNLTGWPRPQVALPPWELETQWI